jgi:hypothetical protein
MDVFVDDEPAELTGENLEALLAAARHHLADGGRVVVDVLVDGQALTEQQLEQPDQLATNGKEVRLYTAHPGELAVDTLKQVKQRLGELAEIHQQAADLLQQDQASEGFQQVAQGVEIWLQTQQAVQHSAELLRLDLANMTVDQQPATEVTAHLADQLRGLKDMLENGDTVALADALAYEWPETVQQWDRLVQTMIDTIEAKK